MQIASQPHPMSLTTRFAALGAVPDPPRPWSLGRRPHPPRIEVRAPHPPADPSGIAAWADSLRCLAARRIFAEDVALAIRLPDRLDPVAAAAAVHALRPIAAVGRSAGRPVWLRWGAPPEVLADIESRSGGQRMVVAEDPLAAELESGLAHLHATGPVQDAPLLATALGLRAAGNPVPVVLARRPRTRDEVLLVAAAVRAPETPDLGRVLAGAWALAPATSPPLAWRGIAHRLDPLRGPLARRLHALLDGLHVRS